MSIVAIGILVAFITVVLGNIFDFVGNWINLLLYRIATLLMNLLDFVQTLFRKLAGLDTTYYQDASGIMQTQENDILFSLITSEVVLQTFFAMAIVGMCLLIITSVIAMIRQEYNTEGAKNSKTGILTNALKGFSFLFIVPVVTVFGIYISNFVLKAVDRATSHTGAGSIAGSVFLAAASDANRVRADKMEGDVISLLGGKTNVVYYNPSNNEWGTSGDGGAGVEEEKIFGVNNISEAKNRENVATKIDNVFAQGSKMLASGGGGTVITVPKAVVEEADTNIKYFSYADADAVSRYYSLGDVDMLVLYVGTIVCIFALYKASFGMIMRLFNAVVLFIISPGIIGIWPMDEGNAFKSWRKKLVSSVISAYGTIVALNLYFVIAGALRNVYLFNEGGALGQYTHMNHLVQALFTIVGALMIKDISATISSLIGADDAYSKGADMSGKVTGAVGKGVGAVAGGFGMVAGGVSLISQKIGQKSLDKSKNDLSDLKKKNASIRAKQAAGEQLTPTEQAQLAQEAELENKITKKAGRQNERIINTNRAFGLTRHFAKNSGFVKGLNTMTGGLIPAFGGDVGKKIDEGLMKKPGVKEAFETQKSYYKNEPTAIGNRLGKFMSGDIVGAINPNVDSKRKKLAEERQAYVSIPEEREKISKYSETVSKTINSQVNTSTNEANAILDALKNLLSNGEVFNVNFAGNGHNGFKDNASLERFGQLIDMLQANEVKAKELGLNVGSRGFTADDFKDILGFDKTENFNKDLIDKLLGLNNITEQKFDARTTAGKVMLDAQQVNTNNDTSDEAIKKLERAADALKQAGIAISNMKEISIQEMHTYAEKEGKPEVAIKALAETMKKDNLDSNKYLQELVEAVKKMTKEIGNK